MTSTSHRGHRLLPHTADIRLEAWAPSSAACLEEAVAALAEAFVDVTRAGKASSLPVDLPRAAEPEDMLVALLDEALFAIDVLGSVPVGAHLETRGQGGLTGAFETVPVTSVTQVGSAPKAVARSGLVFRPESSGTWRCTATVDV